MNHLRPFLSILAALTLLSSSVALAVPLSEAKVNALIKAKVPDAVIAKEIQASGLGFKVSSQTLARFKSAGAGQKTLLALVGAFSKLQVAKVEIPKLLNEVFTALDEGEPTRVEKYFDKFDDPAAVYGSIIRPFNYRGHYIVRIAELPQTQPRRSGGFFDSSPNRPNPSFYAVVRTLDKANNEYEQHIYFTVDAGRAGGPGLIISIVNSPNQKESQIWGEAERNAAINTARNFVYAIIAGNQAKVDNALWPEANSDDIPGATDCYAVLQLCKNEWEAYVAPLYDSDWIKRQNGLKYVVTMTPKQMCPGSFQPSLQLAVENIQGKMHVIDISWDRSYNLSNRCDTFRQQSDPNEIPRLEARFAKYAGKLVSEVPDKQQ